MLDYGGRLRHHLAPGKVGHLRSWRKGENPTHLPVWLRTLLTDSKNSLVPQPLIVRKIRKIHVATTESYTYAFSYLVRFKSRF